MYREQLKAEAQQRENEEKAENDFLEWISSICIYTGYCRYGQFGGGFLCATQYDDCERLEKDVSELDAGDIEALQAADDIAASGAWYGTDKNPAAAMEKMLVKLRDYYFNEINTK